ncbi:MAG: hypothetical protein ACLVB5_00440 [Christensenellales bacterium]
MKRAFPALLALLCATLALLIATSSSPLYAANFWTDTNIYFTIGRGMTRGLMPYRDLFDHKGAAAVHALRAGGGDFGYELHRRVHSGGVEPHGGGLRGLADGFALRRGAADAAEHADSGGGRLLLHGVHAGRKRGGNSRSPRWRRACIWRWR